MKTISKKVSMLLVIFYFSIVNIVFAQENECADLYFSGYYDGAEDDDLDFRNKALIIYNPTEDSIDLSEYAVSLYANGSNSFPTTISLSGWIHSYSLYTIAHDKIDTTDSIVAANIDLYTSDLYFNGNDAVVLEGLGGDELDIIGETGTDPGSGGWTVDTGSTERYTLVRKDTVVRAQTDWATGEDEWDVYPIDSFSSVWGGRSGRCGQVSDVKFVTSSSAFWESAGTVNLEIELVQKDPDNFTQVWVKYDEFANPNNCFPPHKAQANDFFYTNSANITYFPNENGKKIIKISIVNDSQNEFDETICFEFDDFLSDAKPVNPKYHSMVIKDDDPSGLNSSNIDEIKIYPTFAKDYLIINGLIDNKIVAISIHNMLGQHILSENVRENKNIVSLDINLIQDGTYIIKLHQLNGFKVYKFVKIM